MAMLTREEIADLLELHAKAYQLLLWLGRKAVQQPNMLAPEVVKLLARPATCASWLASSRSSLPVDLLAPGPIQDAFVNLFSSFFSTSFRVDHFSLEGKLLDSRLSPGASKDRDKPSGYLEAQALALRHLSSSEGIQMSDAEARKYARRKSLQPHLLVWAYVWELDRRARAKGKGEVVHRIWRSIPLDIRKNLSAQVVWEAREKLLNSLRAFRFT